MHNKLCLHIMHMYVALTVCNFLAHKCVIFPTAELKMHSENDVCASPMPYP